MRLTFVILFVSAALLDSIVCPGAESSRRSSQRRGNSCDEVLYPPPLNERRMPEPLPEQWIHYPCPYYYDAHGVIRDFWKPGSDGLILRGNLVGIRLANGEDQILSHNGIQYIIRLSDGQQVFRRPGTVARVPASAVLSSSLVNNSGRRGQHSG